MPTVLQKLMRHQFDKAVLEQYGNWLAKKYADRTVYLELTLLKSVNQWLIGNKKLQADAKIEYSLSKPVGTDIAGPGRCLSRALKAPDLPGDTAKKRAIQGKIRGFCSHPRPREFFQNPSPPPPPHPHYGYISITQEAR